MNNLFKIVNNPKVKTSELMQQLRDKFPVFSYWNDEELDKEFPAPKEETTRYFKKQVEPDILGKSANDMKDMQICTFRERLIMELEYFNETGEHLDIKGWTMTSSHTSDGLVASAHWDDSWFSAFWFYADCRNDDAGGRSVVSLEPSPLLPSLESAIKIVKEAGLVVYKPL